MKTNLTRIRVARESVYSNRLRHTPGIGTQGTVGTRSSKTRQNTRASWVPESDRVPLVPMVPFSAVCVGSFLALHTLGTDPTDPTGTTDPEPLPRKWNRVEPTSNFCNEAVPIVPVGSVVPLSEVRRSLFGERPSLRCARDESATKLLASQHLP